MNIEEISNSIKDGLKKGYKQNLLLLSSYDNFMDEVREYLLTVNVAQSLLKWNQQHIYEINIEYPVLKFYNNAFPAYKLDIIDLFDMNIISRKSGHSPTDKLYQKIDLAITQMWKGENTEEHLRSLVGIELKGINKNEEDIKKDAGRLARAMLLNDNIEENSIKFCICGFLKRYDTPDIIVTESYINKKMEEEKNHWDKICNKLNSDYKKLKFSIEVFKVENTTYEDIKDIHEKMESDYSDVANSTGIIVGCILKLERP